MSTARELAVRGANVALIDKGKSGQEASWAAGGILSSMRPWSENSASAELSEHGKTCYPAYVRALSVATGIDPEYVRSGLVIIDAAHIDAITSWAQHKCIKIRMDFKYPGLALVLPEQAILLPEIAQIRPPRLLQALRKNLRQLSVSTFENTPITDLAIKQGRFDHVTFCNGKLAADAVIITAGAWSTLILKNIIGHIEIKPIHGQMICLKPDKHILKSIILDGDHYLIPRRDGHVLVGSTMEAIGFNKQTTMHAREKLLAWAISVWPALKTATLVKHWAGLRPLSNTEKPFIGVVPNFKNIYLNAGHFRKGILQAPASATLLADMLSGHASFMDIERFAISKYEKSAKIG